MYKAPWDSLRVSFKIDTTDPEIAFNKLDTVNWPKGVLLSDVVDELFEPTAIFEFTNDIHPEDYTDISFQIKKFITELGL